MQGLESIYFVIVLIISVIIHEIAHGYAALSQGDETALHAGRLTINPIPHIDLFGSIILPLLMVLSGTGIVFGWAKPVPYNPANLRNKRWGEVWVASAGILANLGIALVFGILIRLSFVFDFVSGGIIELASIVVIVNIVLALFNLIPIPPLDGSKILFGVLPYQYQKYIHKLQKYGFLILIVFIFTLWKYVEPLILKLFTLFTGLNF